MITQEILDLMQIPLEDYYICYFDILGYRDFLEKNPEEHKKFLVEVLFSNASIASIIRNTNTSVDIKYRAYSDNFIIYFKKSSCDKYEALRLLSIIVRKIQIDLLSKFKILVRGGITSGEFFADENILFGEGLVKAYDMENKQAQNPRIIIDREVFSKELSLLEKKEFIKKDTDNYYYVNYFFDYGALILLKGKCKVLIENHCRYHPNLKDKEKIQQQEKTIGKYSWLLIKFNQRCEELKADNLKIDYSLKINKRLFKMEISCK